MQKYFNNYAGATGIAIKGAQVIVTKADGSPAAIFSDNGVTPIASLLTTVSGEFEFYAANGDYTITLRKRGLKDEVVKDVQLYDPMDGGAATLGFQQSGLGAVPRTVEEELRERVSVTQFGAKGDGVSVDQAAIVAAVADAFSSGSPLQWPAGTFVSDASIPNFHKVRHNGPGIIKRGTNLFAVEPTITQSNTLFLSPSGSDDNDGLNAAQPFKTLQGAFESLKNYGPFLEGKWTVQLAAGIYTSPGQLINLASREWLHIKGPDVAWGVPTAVLDMAGRTEGYGLWFAQLMRVRVQDIKITNVYGTSVAAGLVLDNGPFCWTQNVHADGTQWAGINANFRCRLLVEGGKFSNGANYGLRVYNSTANTGSNQRRTEISDCVQGIIVQHSYAHIDYIDFANCDTGLIAEYQGHTTNYFNTFTNCNVGWQTGARSTISSKDYTLTNVTNTCRARDSANTEDTETHRFASQYYADKGPNGRSSYGYSAWLTPTVKYQYSNNGTTAGYNLSAFGPCTALWESNSNTVLGLASPDASYSGLWFGDSTSPRREEIRGSGGLLQLYFSSVGAFRFRATDVAPLTDNALSNGTASLRWSVIYAGTGAINTSDEREKTSIQDIDAAAIRAVRRIPFRQFKFNDAVQAKGDDARWHFGVIAQQVKQAFEDEGVDPFAYGVLCYDEWSEQAEVRDEKTGDVLEAYRPAGNRYGVRYDELLCLKLAAMEAA